MPRRLIALLIAVYAIAFAFGAMAAIRWPSLMLFAGLMLEQDLMAGLGNVDWRQLGIIYGAPYFLAALCLYASAICLSKRKKGSVLWYGMGCAAGFPSVFLVDFEAGWWRDPSAGEGAVAGAAAGAVLLAIAVWSLRRRPKPKPQPKPEAVVPAPVIENAVPAAPEPEAKAPVRKPVPAAIARQRALFAEQGQRMLARQRRRL